MGNIVRSWRNLKPAFIIHDVGGSPVPTISAFFGIVIRMYYRDHAPSHFHAYYQEHEATIDIEALAILSGYLPRRALGLVLDWAEIHQPELRDNWTLAEQHQVLRGIKPLE